MGGRYVVRITPADVGGRVSVRARIQAAPGEPSASDTVGTLLSWSEQTLEVQRRDGSIARIAEGDVLAARRLPPTPPRRRAPPSP